MRAARPDPCPEKGGGDRTRESEWVKGLGIRLLGPEMSELLARTLGQRGLWGSLVDALDRTVHRHSIKPPFLVSLPPEAAMR